MWIKRFFDSANEAIEKEDKLILTRRKFFFLSAAAAGAAIVAPKLPEIITPDEMTAKLIHYEFVAMMPVDGGITDAEAKAWKFISTNVNGTKTVAPQLLTLREVAKLGDGDLRKLQDALRSATGGGLRPATRSSR